MLEIHDVFKYRIKIAISIFFLKQSLDQCHALDVRSPNWTFMHVGVDKLIRYVSWRLTVWCLLVNLETNSLLQFKCMFTSIRVYFITLSELWLFHNSNVSNQISEFVKVNLMSKESNSYVCVTSIDIKQVFNKNFEETCTADSDLSSVMFMVFNPVRDELITGGVKGTKVSSSHSLLVYKVTKCIWHYY